MKLSLCIKFWTILWNINLFNINIEIWDMKLSQINCWWRSCVHFSYILWSVSPLSTCTEVYNVWIFIITTSLWLLQGPITWICYKTAQNLSIRLISLTTSRNEVKKFFKMIWLKKNISLQPLLTLRRFMHFTCLAVGSVLDIEQKKMIILIFFSFWESPCLHKKVNWKTVPVLFLVLPCHSISSQIKFSSLF